MTFRGCAPGAVVFLIATLSLVGCNEADILVASGMNPVPTITALSPSSVTAGGAAFTLTIEGSNFIPGSLVRWNGSDRTTTFVSNMHLTAMIPASDIVLAGVAQVTVANPAPGGGTSNAVSFSVIPGVLVRVSVANDGTEAQATRDPARQIVGSFASSVSVGGRFVVFGSVGTSLLASPFLDNVFVRDACLAGPVGCTASTTLVSVTPAGSQGNGSSFGGSISADGRLVAFSSGSTDLVASGVSGIFVRDMCVGAQLGCVPSTNLVSVASDGSPGNGSSGGVSLSADGRFVAFSSGSTNLVPGDTNGVDDVFVRDTCFGASAGCLPSTIRVSLASDGSEASCSPPALTSCIGGLAINADGRFVIFASLATNLISSDTNGVADIFVRDTCVGAPVGCLPSTIRVSVANDGSEANGRSGESSIPSISADGRFVSFDSLASNLVPGDTNGVADMFVRDTCIGGPAGCLPSTVRVSVAIDGSEGNSDSVFGSLSASGRLVAFSSGATNLVPGDTNGVADMFVRDTCLGAGGICVPTTIRVSVTVDGAQANGASFVGGISPDGHFLVFSSLASNLVPGDTNGISDVFLASTRL